MVAKMTKSFILKSWIVSVLSGFVVFWVFVHFVFSPGNLTASGQSLIAHKTEIWLGISVFYAMFMTVSSIIDWFSLPKLPRNGN